MYERLEKTGFDLFWRWVEGDRSEQIVREIIQYLRNSARVDRAYHHYLNKGWCKICEEKEGITFQSYNERLRASNLSFGRKGRTTSE